MDDQNELIRQQFGAHAEAYASSPIHAHGPSLARLIELTRPRPDWTVLDVSTGAGHTALAFAPHVARVVATHLAPEMLATARRLAAERGLNNIEFRPADALALPFDAGAFDAVLNRYALHHYMDARKAIAEMARVRRAGGLVALVDNIVPPDRQIAGAINHFEQLRDPSHHWAYPAARLQVYFNDVGLRVEQSEALQKDVQFEPWADRMGASEETKAQLRQWLDTAPPGAREFLAPRREDDKLFFKLTEVILVGRKG
jgi:ubiquinone/menaquinone biosynthesis C-methylase UbiE